jgi:hypothetical protein
MTSRVPATPSRREPAARFHLELIARIERCFNPDASALARIRSTIWSDTGAARDQGVG